MPMPTNHAVTLAARPSGFPTGSDFKLVESEARSPAEGECLVQALWLSVDPYMRGRMSDRKSYAPSIEIGETMVGRAVGRVVESRAERWNPGDIVFGELGWQEYATVSAETLHQVDPALAPISTALGVLGMPGLTAYFGMTDILAAKAGDTVLVSGAAGAVGSIVGQIAKALGCRAVGIAGSDEKIDYVVNELGFDAAFNYKTTEDYAEALKMLCPDGVDCYFDNVGGEITDAVFPRLNIGARVAICGQISQYNLAEPETGPRQLWHLIVKRAKVQGFLVFDYADRYREGLARLGPWVQEGKIRYRETVVEGLENAPAAFLSMMRGGNIGKQLVHIAE